MQNTLEQAKRLYPKGARFISLSGNIKTPLEVFSLKIAENYTHTIVNTEGGIIYRDGLWAEKV